MIKEVTDYENYKNSSLTKIYEMSAINGTTKNIWITALGMALFVVFRYVYRYRLLKIKTIK